MEAWLLEPTGGQRRSAVFPLLPEGTVQLLPHRSSGIYFSPVFNKKEKKKEFLKKGKKEIRVFLKKTHQQNMSNLVATPVYLVCLF